MAEPLDPHAAIVAGAAGATPLIDQAALTRAVARGHRAARRRALLLVLPLLAFLLVTFALPIGQMLARSVHDDGFSANMPRTVAWFAANPAGSPPGEAAFAALAQDISAAAEARSIGVVGARINHDLPGTRSLFTASGRALRDLPPPPFREAMLALDPRWGDERLWRAMRDASRVLTGSFYLAALDLERDATGAIIRVPEDERVYLMLFRRTFLLSLLVTGITLVLGFPVAHLLASLPTRRSNLLMILVLLPFWTSLLVRTTAWIVLLQQQGVVNDLLVWLGVIGADGRLAMIYNRTGTIIAMTHVLLPFMILPLYSVMRGIEPGHVRAARSLGASSWTAFRRVYLPQALPGVAAGALLVFILATGYYVTPALVGGASGQLISNMIAVHMTETLNWSLAAALSGLLLAGVLVLYWIYDRLVGIGSLKLG